MSQTFDLFLSYRWADKASVEPVLAALGARGVSVWQDAREVDDLASIQHAVATGLASSRALLAWYSLGYNDSRACQWELTSAYAAGQAEGDPRRRILVVNPELENKHVLLPELFDQLHLSGRGIPADLAAVDRLADRLVAALFNVPGSPLGALQSLIPPRWLPSMGTGSSRFVGRLREMWDLHGKLQAGQAAMLTGTGGKAGLALVRGAGGIGKSLMAEEYALRFGAAYPGGVFWLRAYGYADGGVQFTPERRSLSREAQFIDIAERLGIETKGMTTAQVTGALGRRLGAQGSSFLWVVDDFPGDAKVEEIGAWQAPQQLGCTLFTSRTRRFEHLATIELPQLDALDARHLLTRQHALSADEIVLADEICQMLGYHALAVDVTAALVQRRGLAGVKAALLKPGRDALELAAKLDETLPNGHQREIAATFLASIAQLDEPAREMLRYAAVLAVAPIPIELFVEVMAAAEGLDEGEARDRVDLAASQLLAGSLADEAGPQMIAVHTLVSRTMRATDTSPDLVEGARTWVHVVLAGRMSLAEDIREHAQLEGWIEHARALSESADGSEAVELLRRVAQYDFARGAYSQAVARFELLAKVLRAEFGEKHEETLAAVGSQASASHAAGKLADARRLQEELVIVQRRGLGTRHPNTLISMGNLAGTLNALGDLAGARTLQDQVLMVRRCDLGEEHPDTLNSMHELARTLRAQGDLASARTLQDQVLVVRRRVLGDEHPDTLRSMGSLAVTLSAQGDLIGARGLHQEVMEVRHRVLGAEHPDTLNSINNLAATLDEQGDLNGARSLNERALAGRRRVLGEEHPDTLRSMGNLADTLLAQGDLAGARSLQDEVLASQRRVLGEEHPNTLTSMSNLAATLRAQGDLVGARSLNEQALAIRRRVLGGEHPGLDPVARTGWDWILKWGRCARAQGYPPAAWRLPRKRRRWVTRVGRDAVCC